jgi:hypothetical protein
MIVFDDRGSRWLVSSTALQIALRSSLSGKVLGIYSVINIGFVAAEQTGRSVAIRLRPAVASGAALAGLFYWLSGQPADRILVCSFENKDWRHALVGSQNDAMAHLCRLPRSDGAK